MFACFACDGPPEGPFQNWCIPWSCKAVPCCPIDFWVSPGQTLAQGVWFPSTDTRLVQVCRLGHAHFLCGVFRRINWGVQTWLPDMTPHINRVHLKVLYMIDSDLNKQATRANSFNTHIGFQSVLRGPMEHGGLLLCNSARKAVCDHGICVRRTMDRGQWPQEVKTFKCGKVNVSAISERDKFPCKSCPARVCN